MKSRFKQGVYRLLKIQFGLSLALACIFYYYIDMQSAYSALLAGMVCLLPTYCFAARMFKYQGAQQAKKIVNAFYKGEAVKILFSMLLFALVFITIPIAASAFFITYILVQSSFWVTPWLFKNN